MKNSISKFQRRINKSDLRDLGQRGVARADLTFLPFSSQFFYSFARILDLGILNTNSFKIKESIHFARPFLRLI